MQTTQNKVIVKIDKKKLDEKRNKEGRFHILGHLQDFTRNLQYGEVVSFCLLAKELCPEIEIGCTAIFHHVVEHRIENKNMAEGAKIKRQIDERIIFTDPNGDEYRYLFVDRNSLATELFGVIIGDNLYPSKDNVFCAPFVKQTDYQLVKGIYINTEADLKSIDEQLEIVQHGISEMFRVLTELPPKNEINLSLYENTEKSLSEFEKQRDELNTRKQRIVVHELNVLAISSAQINNELNINEKILIDSKKLYPLDFMGMTFALIRMYDLIFAKKIENELIPLNNYIIVKQDLPSDKNGSIIIPDNAKLKPLQGIVTKIGIGSRMFPMDIYIEDRVVFNKKGNIEIVINEKPYLIVHSQNVIYTLNNKNMKVKKLLSDRLFVKPEAVRRETETGIIIPDTAIEKPSKGIITKVGIECKNNALQEGDSVMFMVGAGIKMEIQGEEILVIRESEIICTI